MTSIFDFVDKEAWLKTLQKPLWYREIVPQFKTLAEKTQLLSDGEKHRLTQEMYEFFEELFVADKIFFGKEEGVWDSERKVIDKIIIHHTGEVPGMTLDRLSAIEIIRLYAPFYFSPHTDDGDLAKDKPISSGHIRNGKQVFWPYNWIIRNDGTPERLLEDHEVGWQAGKWEINCRSVAIVFDDDLENKVPTEIQLAGAVKVIRENYSNILRENITGHMEVNEKTKCPSNLFLGENGWKKKLLEIFD